MLFFFDSYSLPGNEETMIWNEKLEGMRVDGWLHSASLVGHGDLPDDEVTALGLGGRRLLAVRGLRQTVQLAAFVP